MFLLAHRAFLSRLSRGYSVDNAINKRYAVVDNGRVMLAHVYTAPF